MKLLDVNVLLYAVDQDAEQHDALRTWLEEAIVDREPVLVPWIVILGFLRISTHARVFSSPLPLDRAVTFVHDFLAHPNVRIVAESRQHWAILRDLLAQTGAAGNLTTDAHLAALAISYGAVLYSCDADFARFPALRWKNPLTAG